MNYHKYCGRQKKQVSEMEAVLFTVNLNPKIKEMVLIFCWMGLKTVYQALFLFSNQKYGKCSLTRPACNQSCQTSILCKKSLGNKTPLNLPWNWNTKREKFDFKFGKRLTVTPDAISHLDVLFVYCEGWSVSLWAFLYSLKNEQAGGK